MCLKKKSANYCWTTNKRVRNWRNLKSYRKVWHKNRHISKIVITTRWRCLRTIFTFLTNMSFKLSKIWPKRIKQWRSSKRKRMKKLRQKLRILKSVSTRLNSWKKSKKTWYTRLLLSNHQSVCLELDLLQTRVQKSNSFTSRSQNREKKSQICSRKWRN